MSAAVPRAGTPTLPDVGHSVREEGASGPKFDFGPWLVPGMTASESDAESAGDLVRQSMAILIECSADTSGCLCGLTVVAEDTQ